MKSLDELFAVLGQKAPPTPVAGVTHDSRKVEPGFVYVALKGQRHDGHDFIPDALKRGAVAVVGENALSLPVPYARVENARRALSALAAAFHDHPSRVLKVIGVTGTDGKTTTSHLIHYLLNALGTPAGLVSSVGYAFGDEWRFPEGHFTTPEAPELQAVLAEIRDRGLTHAVVETSSHALAQHRVADVDYDLAVWTHLTPEHLDFHGDMEGYFEAKAELVRRAPFSVLNAGCPYARRLFSRPHLAYGEGGALFARNVEESPEGLRFFVVDEGQEFPVVLPMIGAYNVENALAALAALKALGHPVNEAARALARFPGVPGRMQVISSRPVRLVVDFAHTPKALEKALSALRPTTEGRLLVVIGAAGERDPGKRRPLGAVASRLADVAIFTEEDSRSEPTEKILAELAAGAREGGAEVHRVPDRKEAIRLAARLARPGDTVLFAGKGHERTLERADAVLPWDEAAEVRRAFGVESA